jgi:predicted DNA-binding transcriptional regulator YafY
MREVIFESYSIMKGYFLPPLLFTPKEASILGIGTEFVKDQTDASYKKDVESAFLKIEAILPDKARMKIQELKKRIALRYYELSILQRETIYMEQIKEAMLRRNLIQMRYQIPSKKEGFERNVEPLGLIFSDGFWYLVAYCHLKRDGN